MAETGTTHHLEKHEPGGISVWTVISIAAGFLLFVAVSLAALYVYYAWSTSAVPPPRPRSFPKPALETMPLPDLKTLQERQKSQLEGYAWVDRAHGVARIPIERAKQILAARGAGAYGPITIESAPSNAPSTQPAPGPKEGHP